MKKFVESKTNEIKTHLIFISDYSNVHEDELKSFMQKTVKKYEIDSVMVTTIQIWRHHLITKERMENYCKGKELQKESVNDDFESLIQNLRLGKQPDNWRSTYFLPKLTTKELKLVQSKDLNYLDTFLKRDPDVDEAEMKLSESKSKFVYAVQSSAGMRASSLPSPQFATFF